MREIESCFRENVYNLINSSPDVIVVKAEVEVANARRFPMGDLVHCVLGVLDLRYSV